MFQAWRTRSEGEMRANLALYTWRQMSAVCSWLADWLLQAILSSGCWQQNKCLITDSEMDGWRWKLGLRGTNITFLDLKWHLLKDSGLISNFLELKFSTNILSSQLNNIISQFLCSLEYTYLLGHVLGELKTSGKRFFCVTAAVPERVRISTDAQKS